MSLYRGAGGASDATDDSTVNAVAGYASSASSSASAANASAIAASANADGAETAAASAASVASGASTSASNASASAVTAANYASAASGDSSSAAASATAAGISAGLASSSETNAASSASTASTHATTATNQATAADGSATAAAASAVDALAYAASWESLAAAVTDAEAAETAALASESAAAASAGESAASAVTSYESEQNAGEWATVAQNAANSSQAYATSASDLVDLVTVNGAVQVALATTQAANAAASAADSSASADESAGSAASALAIYGSTEAQAAAVISAQTAANLSESYAAASASAVEQDLSGVTATALHRSPNAITSTFVYDTSKDSDGGAWTEKCQNTSWYNEALSGTWLGAQASETTARAVSGATTNDYYQLTTDGKFYKLNVTSGVTEVFRGNKRDFPRLAGIVAEAASVSIYDLTEPSRPMWMRFINTNSGFLNWTATYGALSVTAAAATTGIITIGTSTGGGVLVDFAKDTATLMDSSQYHTSPVLKNRLISNRNSGTGYFTGNANNSYLLTSRIVNAVAMTTMPDAPIDAVTGLAVPTVAVATGSGVSVIQDDGSVSSRAATAWTKITLTPELLSVGYAGGLWYYGSSSATANTPPLAPNKLPATFLLSSNDTTDALDFNQGNTAQLIATSRSDLIRSSGALVQTLVNNEDVVTKGVTSTIAPTYNTGHLAGDIRRAYLADIGAGSLIAQSAIADPTFSSGVGSWVGVNATISTAGAGDLTATSLSGTGASIFGFSIPLSGLVIGREYTILLGIGTGLKVDNDSGAESFKGIVSIDGATITLFGRATDYNAIRFTAANTTATLDITNGYSYYTVWHLKYVYVVASSVLQRCYKNANIFVNGVGTTGAFPNVAFGYGTLTKTEVASAAQMVAYSGFSATDYIQEPYSADLDFGTGEFSVGAWANVPVVLPTDGTELVTNGTFDTDTTGWTGVLADLSAVGGELVVTSNDVGSQYAEQLVTVVVGKTYRVSAEMRAGTSTTRFRVGTSALGLQYASFTATNSVTFVATSTSLYLSAFNGTATVGFISYYDNILVQEVPAAQIADRAFSSGPSIKLGVDPFGKLTATAYDGTTTRTVTTTAAYNKATWIKPEAVYTTDGSLAIRVNGVEAAVTRGNPLLTMTNASAVLTIGNSYDLDAPFPGSIALVKLGATVPTAEQSQWMYEQEKPMFNAGAQVCLADTGTIVDLAYDESTDRWIAASAGYRNEFDGLVRTDAVASPAGSYSKLAAAGGVKLQARITTTPGVDITIPSYNLREELVKRSEAAAKLNAQTAVFDYVGGFTANTTSGNTAILSAAGLTYPTNYLGAKVSGSGIPANTTIVAVSGTTLYLSAAATATATGVQISFFDFILPVGMEAQSVVSAGAVKTEGSTKDFTVLYDGFKETVRFGTEPGYTAAVQITTVRSTV